MIVVSSKKMNGIKEIQEEILSFLPDKGAKYREIKQHFIPVPDIPLVAPPKPLTIKDRSTTPFQTKKTIPKLKKLSKTTNKKLD